MAKYISGTARDQTMLLPATVDDYIAENSPVRALDAFADTLNLAELGFSVRNEVSGGRSSYDPAVMIKLYLWGYLKRSRSSRALEEACTANLGAIWLTGDLRPDHSTISDFRKSHPVQLKKIFREFNLLCLEMGLFGRELIAIDGTFIKAVNSKANSFTKTKIRKLIEGIDKATDRYLKQLEETDTTDSNSPVRETKASALQEKIAKIRARKAELQKKLSQCENSPTGQLSLTDSDSVQLSKNGKTTVGYNVQSAVDAKHHLVASVEVTQDGNDAHQLDAMAQQAKSEMGLTSEAPIKALADTGYAIGSELTKCEENNTTAIVAIRKHKSETNGKYNEADFQYQTETDQYQCPSGQLLSRAADRKDKKGKTESQAYQNIKACHSCPLKSRCTSGKFRRIYVSVHKPAIQAARERLEAEPKAMRQRGSLAEHPFGTIKDRNGRHDLLCKGKEMAGAEMGLSFWAYNFTRAINVLGVQRILEAIAARAMDKTAKMTA